MRKVVTQVCKELVWTLPKAWRAALEDCGADSMTGDRSGPPTEPRSESTLSPQAESRKGGLCFHSGGLSLWVTGGALAAGAAGTVPVVTTPPHLNLIWFLLDFLFLPLQFSIAIRIVDWIRLIRLIGFWELSQDELIAINGNVAIRIGYSEKYWLWSHNKTKT